MYKWFQFKLVHLALATTWLGLASLLVSMEYLPIAVIWTTTGVGLAAGALTRRNVLIFGLCGMALGIMIDSGVVFYVFWAMGDEWFFD